MNPNDSALRQTSPELLSALKAACQDIRLAAEIHRAKGLDAAAIELTIHEKIYQQAIAKAEGRA